MQAAAAPVAIGVPELAAQTDSMQFELASHCPLHDAVFVARDNLEDQRKTVVQKAKTSPHIYYYAISINQNEIPGSRFLLGPIKDRSYES